MLIMPAEKFAFCLPEGSPPAAVICQKSATNRRARRLGATSDNTLSGVSALTRAVVGAERVVPRKLGRKGSHPAEDEVRRRLPIQPCRRASAGRLVTTERT